MVHSRIDQLDDTFFALSHPMRRAILARLGDRSMSVGELAEPFDLSPAAISKHLKVLKRAGLVTQRRSGLGRQCTIKTDSLHEAHDWLREHLHSWDEQLTSFARYAKRTARQKARGPDNERK